METALSRSLAAAGVKFIRILWCDNANVIRGKAVHIGALVHHQEHGVGISPAQQAIPVMYDAVVPESGLGPVGEIRLVPDWSTLCVSSSPGHARVIGDMVTDGASWACCPRNFLKRMVAEAEAENLEIMAAFENEFYLLRRSPAGVEPADNTVFGSLMAMISNQPVIDEIAAALTAQGIPVEQYYPESGPGQHEISISHTHILGAADRQIAFRETVHAVASRHGLEASFLPKVFSDKAGNGCHLHLSLWRKGQNLVPDPAADYGLSKIARGFIAGILNHLPALMALTTPSPNSYRRIAPHCWSGAFRAWGLDNREAAVRVPTHPASPGPTKFELKTIDASANPYLALSATIAAGMDGVRRGLDPGEPVDLDPGCLPEAERSKRGFDPLPSNLGDAIYHLSRDHVLLTALGAELAQAYLAVRKAEWEELKDMDLEKEVNLLRGRY
jgi:glutamine synthetase